MLEKPGLPDERIATHLLDRYELAAAAIDFLPLGADQHTAAYQVVDSAGITYFLKLRRGLFDITSVLLPTFLAVQGIRQIIAPLADRAGQLWTDLAGYRLVLYPYVNGIDGYERPLTGHQCFEFGRVMRAIHTAALPPELQQHLHPETFSPKWRDRVLAYMGRIGRESFNASPAVQLAAFLSARHRQVEALVKTAGDLGRKLAGDPPPVVLCHGDIHAGNVLLAGDGRWFLVDWDDPVLAPKERDLMHIGGGVGAGSVWTEAAAGALFYDGYGQTEIDRPALTYYRCERMVQDIAAFCHEILDAAVGPKDQERGLGFLMSSFAPGGVVDIALASAAGTG
jgi:spectinomycin phosphotransferase